MQCHSRPSSRDWTCQLDRPYPCPFLLVLSANFKLPRRQQKTNKMMRTKPAIGKREKKVRIKVKCALLAKLEIDCKLTICAQTLLSDGSIAHLSFASLELAGNSINATLKRLAQAIGKICQPTESICCLSSAVN